MNDHEIATTIDQTYDSRNNEDAKHWLLMSTAKPKQIQNNSKNTLHTDKEHKKAAATIIALKF